MGGLGFTLPTLSGGLLGVGGGGAAKKGSFLAGPIKDDPMYGQYHAFAIPEVCPLLPMVLYMGMDLYFRCVFSQIPALQVAPRTASYLDQSEAWLLPALTYLQDRIQVR